MTKPAKLYTTLPVDPNNGWQPTSKTDTGAWCQYRVTGPHTWAVESTCHDGSILYQHGPWDEMGARRFCRSMCDGDRSRAVLVEAYYYCEAWGRVPAASVGPLDEDRASDWRAPLKEGTVLGSDKTHPLGGGTNVEKWSKS